MVTSSSVARPAAAVVLLRALDVAIARRADARQLLELIHRSGWAIVPRTAPKDEETWDMVRTAALCAAYRSDDVFTACYAAVVEQAENTLLEHLAIVGRLHVLPAGEEERAG